MTNQPIDPYEIIITDEDIPGNAELGKPRFREEMVHITVAYPKRWIRRVDRAAASIGTARPHVMRAIVRQAIENESAVIRTKWGRSHVV
jgi:hypothetical protein